MFGFGSKYSKEEFDGLEAAHIKAEKTVQDSGEILEEIAGLTSGSELNKTLYKSDEGYEKSRLEEKRAELARIKTEKERLLRLAEEEAYQKFDKAA